MILFLKQNIPEVNYSSPSDLRIESVIENNIFNTKRAEYNVIFSVTLRDWEDQENLKIYKGK